MEKETDNQDLQKKLKLQINEKSNQRKKKFRLNLDEEQKALRRMLDAEHKKSERKLAKTNDSKDVLGIKRKQERERK